MCIEDRAVVERLTLAGITLSATLDVPGGGQTVLLNADAALAYIARPEAFSADYFGLSLEDYETWVALDGQAICGATTKTGTRCRNPVSGPIQLSSQQWRERHGGLCATHGGDSAHDAEA
ncbi:hypothetical protein [Caulobacter sp. DWR1-3-2b1]|uniref:hypothetical protein n=1 Tax=Caulobacter sp. DWR1-3-2b1 TaxID=2804670 RepID=UPI003CF8FCD8